jgi:hypothetical protein
MTMRLFVSLIAASSFAACKAGTASNASGTATNSGTGTTTESATSTATTTATTTETTTETTTATDTDTDLGSERDLEDTGVPACAELTADSDAPGVHAAADAPALEPAPDLSEVVPIGEGESTYLVTDSELGAVSGHDGNGAWCLVSSDGVNAGEVVTDVSGSFRQIVPLFCGKQVLKFTWASAAGKRVVATTKIDRTGCTSEAGGLRLTLSWGAGANDLEMHLIREGGKLNNSDGATNDCTWTSCVNSQPDWGSAGDTADDPKKDVDNTGENGTENIFLPKVEQKTYDVMVEYWGSGGATSPKLVFNMDGKTQTHSIPALKPQEVWHAAVVDAATGEITLKDTVIDCSSEWSSGCRKALP